MQDRLLNNPKVEMAWNSVVTEVYGDMVISGVQLTDTKTGETRDVECKGLFIAIGHQPNVAFLDGKLDVDEGDYLVLKDVDRTTTKIEGVFAAGDVTDNVYRQAITAAGQGCKAALDAERWLAAQGID